MKPKLIQTKDYLLLIDEEAEVYRGQYRFLNNKIELIHEGHNYPYKGEKIIAYYPINSEAKELEGLPELPNPFKGVDVFGDLRIIGLSSDQCMLVCDYINNNFKPKQFSLDDVLDFVEWINLHYRDLEHTKSIKNVKDTKELFNYYLTLSTQQLPKEFIPEYIKERKPNTDINGDDAWVESLKTITNSEGKQEIQGKYKY